ncbi:MAG TPA: methylenetetrahydrofolate reductase [Dissulfurispiraceae bacterium]|nr:methylenetetrahydrofolate reductase [Dissulfurispiraceae bacterium]
MSLQTAFEKGKFVVTSEIGPPKGTDTDGIRQLLDLYRGTVDAVNATDNQSAVMRMSSVAVSKIILEHGVEPILQMTCRDRNRIGLQSDLLGAHALGIRNVVVMTGDHVLAGDHKQAKPVYDVESVQLLNVINSLNSGTDMMGNLLKGKTCFFAGAVVTPEANPLEPQLMKFAKKVQAGAKYFQTQAIYDITMFKVFMEYARRHPAKVLAGIVVLKNERMARYLNEHVAGIRVPQELVAELAAAPNREEKQKAGIRIAARHIRRLREERICDGVHIMAIGMEDTVPMIMHRAGLLE